AAVGVLGAHDVVESPLRRGLEDRIGSESDRLAHGNCRQALGIVWSAAKIPLSVLLGDQILQTLLNDLVVCLIVGGALMSLAGGQERQQAESGAGDIVVLVAFAGA